MTLNVNTNHTHPIGGSLPAGDAITRRLLKLGKAEEWIAAASTVERLAELAGCTLRECLLEADPDAFGHKHHADSEQLLEETMLEVGELLTERHAASRSTVPESAITDAALLAELSEPDALDELENIAAMLRNVVGKLGRVEAELEAMRADDGADRLEELTRTLRAALLEQRRAANPEGSATFHLPRVYVTAKRLEQLLGVDRRKASEVLDALRSSGLLTESGQLSVRVELEPCEGPR